MTIRKEKFDIAVIGAGPGGYVAAIKASQMGKKVALIEKEYLGGTCLNIGCIPTKTLLAGAEVLHAVKHAAQFGISTGPVSVEYAKMKHRKDSVVETMRRSLGGLLQSNQISIFHGAAEFTAPKEIKILGKESLMIAADAIIIATGSEPLDIPAFPCDHSSIYNSTSILSMTELPGTLAVIGGGYIGCEFASLYAELGVKVTILEMLPSIVALQGQAVADALTKAFVKKGIEIKTQVKVESIEKTPCGLSVRTSQGTVACDKVLVSVGRKIVSNGLNLREAGVVADEKGAISTNDKMETNVPGIYAIGDVTGRFLLAHVASHQGIVAAINACGGEAHMHYEAVPAVIFTHPEIATVGMTLEQAQAAGYSAAVGKFPFQALGKAVASMQTEGFAQVITDTKTGQILGAQVVGHDAATLIAEVTLAIANEVTADALGDTIHAHPTLAEAWMEASFLAMNVPIHFPPKVKRTNG